MKKQLTDEQIDQMVGRILNDAAVDDNLVNEIAASPVLWWSVQRQINEQKALSVAPWPPIAKFWRVLLAAAPVAAVVAVVIGVYVFRPGTGTETANLDQINTTRPADSPIVATLDPAVNNVITAPESPNTKPVGTASTVKKSASRSIKTLSETPVVRHKSAVKPHTVETAKNREIKTDFIALSYARSADSGQIVRVKVPSSMMVTLGVVPSVEKPSSMIDAEVIVGDDGLSRAIRFIR